MLNPRILLRSQHTLLGIVAAGLILAGCAAASASPRSSARGSRGMNVLAGNGVGQARFGESSSVAIHRISLLLKERPANPYFVVQACRLDHGTEWAGLTAFFRHGRFVGYSYAGSAHTARLATIRGLAVGDTLGRGQKLYGRALRMSTEQGGAYIVSTAHGRIDGFTSGSPPITTKSRVRTIEAGHVGCPAMTP